MTFANVFPSRSETIRVDLIVFLAIFADVATIAIAYDNAQSAHRPVEWQLPKVWLMSTVLGLLLAGGTWIARATLFVGRDGKGGIVQNYGSIQEVLFLEVALTESWLILITRVSLALALQPLLRSSLFESRLTLDFSGRHRQGLGQDPVAVVLAHLGGLWCRHLGNR